MDDQRLEPIPSPPGHLLREFQHRLLPLLVFGGALVATILVWNARFTGTQLFGEVEAIRANVTAAEGGTLISLEIDRFDCVSNNQVIGTVQLVDPDTVRSELEVLRAELQTMRSRMSLDEARNDQNVESLHAQWLEARVELATARVKLENARSELTRADRLRAEKIVSDAEYELALSIRDALEAEVAERARLVDALSGAVQRLTSANQKDRGGAIEVLSEALSAQEAKLKVQSVQKLRSPLAGVVRSLNNHVGERLPPGTVVAVITAPHSERIIGFVRQPLAIEPRPGMPVEIRTRGSKRQTAPSRIVSVGTDLELVNSPLRLRGFDNALERGLPFSVELPPGLDVHPGELVDLVVHPRDL